MTWYVQSVVSLWFHKLSFQFLPTKNKDTLNHEEENKIDITDNNSNDDEKFKIRHNYPYKRQPKLGNFGLRRSTTTQKPATEYHSNFGFEPVEAKTESPRVTSGPFVTMPHDNVENSTMARQPKKAKYSESSSSNRHEVKVLPPKEFRHLLARVDGTVKEVRTVAQLFFLCL